MHTIEDTNRRDINLHQSKVKDILPEYFLAEYPDFVVFLEKYYEYLEDDTTHSFDKSIKNLYSIKDISQTDIDNLDLILAEIGDGLTAASFFQNPRLMLRLLSNFYRAKGTVVSTEGFFRSFYNQEVTVEYPKNNIFIVGESEIGYESLKFIQDNRIYQIFSILLKIGMSVTDYESLYKKLIHPAGWHFAGEVVSQSEVNLGITGRGDDVTGLYGSIIFVAPATVDPATGFNEITALIDSDGNDIRVNVNELIEQYQDVTVSELNALYSSIAQILTPNSFTYDDSDNTSRPDTSMTLETTDNSIFTRYTSDSSI